MDTPEVCFTNLLGTSQPNQVDNQDELSQYNTIMVYSNHYVFVHAYIMYTPRTNPKVNYGLWMTVDT
jgi:predicted RNase H-like nuclease